MPADALTLRLPRAPALIADSRGAVWLTPDGEIEDVPVPEAIDRARAEVPYVCHLPAVLRALDTPPFAAFDLLELFAFVRPARFCLPTVRGLASAIGVAPPEGQEEAASLLPLLAARLLAELQAQDAKDARAAIGIARVMAAGDWPWAPFVLHALSHVDPGRRPPGLDVWSRLPEWRESSPDWPEDDVAVSGDDARERLATLVRGREPRPAQSDYAAAVAEAFAPRDPAGLPHVVLAEAGTGIGKTLGYLAPASLWSERNDAPVWISTYTRNLQRQIDGELRELFGEAADRAQAVTLRKGRENYLCLLNYEEAVSRHAIGSSNAVALGLVARWALTSRDGDLQGGDFPAWLAGIIGRQRTASLTDRRGECVRSACPHYTRCFAERAIRRARRARIVVANHALVMAEAASGRDGDRRPRRFVFDEAHHLFDAADSAFSWHLTGFEASLLRRWIRGTTGGRRRLGGGLLRRFADLAEGDGELQDLLEKIVRAARNLPREGWLGRSEGEAVSGSAPAIERFLAAAARHVNAQAGDSDPAYGLEAPLDKAEVDLLDAAAALREDLLALIMPMEGTMELVQQRLDAEDAPELPLLLRLESLRRALQPRLTTTLFPWVAMLTAVAEGTPNGFVDWLTVDRTGGESRDIGLHRHFVDPTKPLAGSVIAPLHGVVLTSATLRDAATSPDADWMVAEVRTGAQHLPMPPKRVSIASPFDYPQQTRIFVVTDVPKADAGRVAQALAQLFDAAGGGALGLFTSIARLRAVHARLRGPLAAVGLPLLAQHVDRMDTGTLVDIFRAEEDSCLLGTDATRDGIDVPGRSLRLVVFDRVPWPRRTLLHDARRKAFGGAAYDDVLIRLRLKQAFGRLIRRAGDQGVFVLLDPALPSRLHGAFPPGVAVTRVPLAEAVLQTRAFLQGSHLANAVDGAEANP